MNASEPRLRFEGVTKRFGGTLAVDAVSTSLAAGEIYGLIGPNGSGKTTLVNLVSGLLPLDRGRIMFDGRAIERARPHQMAALGVVRTFQMPKSFGSLTVLDNLLVPLSADHRREPMVSARARAAEALAWTGLDHLADAAAATLSGGQTMLLQFARALMHDPVRLLLLDEPFAGVAPVIKERMIETIVRLKRERGATALLVSHELATVRQLCTRVGVMNAGRLIAEGPLAEVAERREVIDAYLGKPV
ncbi:MAG: ATP-binding cassette domain-containing protein [Chloroflexota bacterium]|nr:ATP-binding cassette domain-containing protein [Chloroflexota bacterium]